MVSDSTLISMPLNGLAALMNHSISFSLLFLGQRRRLEFVVDPLLGRRHLIRRKASSSSALTGAAKVTAATAAQLRRTLLSVNFLALSNIFVPPRFGLRKKPVFGGRRRREGPNHQVTRFNSSRVSPSGITTIIRTTEESEREPEVRIRQADPGQVDVGADQSTDEQTVAGVVAIGRNPLRSGWAGACQPSWRRASPRSRRRKPPSARSRPSSSGP